MAAGTGTPARRSVSSCCLKSGSGASVQSRRVGAGARRSRSARAAAGVVDRADGERRAEQSN